MLDSFMRVKIQTPPTYFSYKEISEKTTAEVTGIILNAVKNLIKNK